MKEQGHVLSVSIERLGDDLDADATTGATTLVVGDVADFDELGGSLWINGDVLRYSAVDDAAGTIALVDPLPTDADTNDAVYVWDTRLEQIVVEHVAMVEVDGDYEGDAIEAVIALHLINDLPVGIRGLEGESVLIEEEDDAWRLIDVLGSGGESTVGVQFMQDSTTVTEVGDQTVELTYVPITNSEHLYWNGVYQPGTEWTRDGQAVSVPDSGEVCQVDDVLTVEYAYREGGVTPPSDVPLGGEAVVVAHAPGYASVDIPDAVETGDLMLLFVGRNVTAGPAGWTEIAAVAYSVTRNVALYAKTSDGTETSATWTTASSNPAGIVVAIRGWADYEVVTVESVTPAPDSYSPAGGNVKFVGLDGDAAFDQGVDTVYPYALEIVHPGFWGMACSEGDAIFNGTDTGVGEGQVWYGITVEVT